MEVLAHICSRTCHQLEELISLETPDQGARRGSRLASLKGGGAVDADIVNPEFCLIIGRKQLRPSVSALRSSITPGARLNVICDADNND